MALTFKYGNMAHWLTYTPFSQWRGHLECRPFWYPLKHRFDLFTLLEGVHKTMRNRRTFLFCLNYICSHTPGRNVLLHIYFFFFTHRRYGTHVTENERKQKTPIHPRSFPSLQREIWFIRGVGRVAVRQRARSVPQLPPHHQETQLRSEASTSPSSPTSSRTATTAHEDTAAVGGPVNKRCTPSKEPPEAAASTAENQHSLFTPGKPTGSKPNTFHTRPTTSSASHGRQAVTRIPI